MGDKIPIAAEKTYKFEGIYDIKDTYDIIIQYLENSRHYDVTEKDYEEKNSSGIRKIVSKSEAELMYNDYFKPIIKFEIYMEGKDIDVQINDKKTISLTKGSAKIVINSYIEVDWQAKKEDLTILTSFLKKVYNKLFGRDELNEVIGVVAGDVNQMIVRFKQQMNSKLK